MRVFGAIAIFLCLGAGVAPSVALANAAIREPDTDTIKSTKKHFPRAADLSHPLIKAAVHETIKATAAASVVLGLTGLFDYAFNPPRRRELEHFVRQIDQELTDRAAERKLVARSMDSLD